MHYNYRDRRQKSVRNVHDSRKFSISQQIKLNISLRSLTKIHFAKIKNELKISVFKSLNGAVKFTFSTRKARIGRGMLVYTAQIAVCTRKP